MTTEGGADTKASEHLFAYVSNAVPFVSWKRHSEGTHVYQTEPSMTATPAPVLSSGSFIGPLNEVTLSGTPSPFVSTRCVTRSSFPAVVVHSAFALGRPLLVHLQSVFDGPQLKIILKPELGGAIVFNTLLSPEGLSDEERAVVSDAEGKGSWTKMVRESGATGAMEGAAGWRQRPQCCWFRC